MYRRQFLSTALSATGMAAQKRPDLLLPSDTPDEHKFRLMWYNPVPPIDVRNWKLKLSGMVDKPQLLSLAELRKMPQESLDSRMKCVQCWSSRATWGGVRFGHFVELVKPAKGAKAVRIDCADKWFEYFSLEDILSPRVLLAMDMAGKPLSDAHGAPLRLIDPRRYGYKSAKLITSIEFVSEGKGSMACDIGPYYSPDGLIQAGYDQPLDLGGARRKIRGGEITDY